MKNKLVLFFNKKKNRKWIIVIALAIVAVIVFIIMGAASGKKTNPNALEQKAIEVANDEAQIEIDKIVSEPGYTGRVEIDKYYGFVFKSYNYSQDKTAVMVRYQLSKNEYSQHVGNEKRYIIAVFYKGELIDSKAGELKASSSEVKEYSNLVYSQNNL